MCAVFQEYQARRSLPAAALLAAILTGCGGGAGSSIAPELPLPPAPPAPAPTGLLVPPSDENTLVDAFLRGLAPSLTGALESGDAQQSPDPGAVAPPALDAGGFSTTYRLEVDVDEHDVVKYDGERLFIAPTRGGGCCFLVEPLAADAALLPPPADTGPRRIRILGTDRDSATAQELGSIELASDQTVEGLYISGDTLTTITSSAWWGLHGDQFASFRAWESQTLSLGFYDVSNPGNPTLRWQLSVDGAVVTTRLIGDRLLVISRHYPEIPELDYNAVDEEAAASNQAILDGLQTADLLPKVRINGELVDGAISDENCLLTDPQNDIAPDSAGYPVLTTLLVVDVAAEAIEEVLCYAEPTDGVYVSAGAAYLAQTVYDNPEAVDSIVHRFDIDSGIEYRGSARIAGSLSGRGQTDFRMSESDDVLRVVTTRWTNNDVDAFDHRLFTLAPADDDIALEVLAQLPESADAPPIGKPNEDLFGVRFLGNRAYLVTFERIDPLYVLDLSDPRAPFIAGELEVSGFSDLLHPVSESLLLGLGDDGVGNTKLELFDVSDASAPRSLSVLVLAQDAVWSWSEARYDRRAFTYLPGTESTDRFTVPLSFAYATSVGFEQRERLYMMEVRDKTVPANATLAIAGTLDVTPGPYLETRPRAVIDEDAVFFVLGDQLWSGFWGALGDAMGPF
ncbi:MAG: hypothetical protein ACI87W_001937 [Halieaceae bacterium]|jgi:hypothetical protein